MAGEFGSEPLINFDWSGLANYYSDANALNREIDNAVLGAGLTELARFPELTDPNFYAAYAAGDPAAIAKDAQIASSVQAAQDQIRQYYANQTSTTTPLVYPTPTTTPPPPPPPPPPPVKTAPIDTVLFNDDLVDTTIIADLILENIGGQEILSIARYDTINGQDVPYQPIKNLNLIQQQYNPNNILRLQQTSDTIFANFAINLESKVPFVGNGTNGENVYLNDTGDLVIDLVNLLSDEEIEIEIIQDGTIYEVQI